MTQNAQKTLFEKVQLINEELLSYGKSAILPVGKNGAEEDDQTSYRFKPQSVIYAVNNHIGIENWRYTIEPNSAEKSPSMLHMTVRLFVRVGNDEWLEKGGICGELSSSEDGTLATEVTIESRLCELFALLSIGNMPALPKPEPQPDDQDKDRTDLKSQTPESAPNPQDQHSPSVESSNLPSPPNSNQSDPDPGNRSKTPPKRGFTDLSISDLPVLHPDITFEEQQIGIDGQPVKVIVAIGKNTKPGIPYFKKHGWVWHGLVPNCWAIRLMNAAHA